MAVPDPTDAEALTPAVARNPADSRLDDADVGGRVVRGGALRIGSMAVTNLLVALGAVILLRYLGVDDFGRYGTVMALVAIVQGVTDAGLTITATREMALVHGEERRHLLSHVLGLRIVLTGIGVVGTVAFAALVGYDGELVLGTALAGVGVFLFSVQGAMLLPLAVELRNGTLALSEVLRQGLLVAGWVALVVAGASLVGFFAVQIFAGVLLLAVTPLLLSRQHLVRPRWTGSQLRSLAAVGLPVAIAGVVAVIYYRVLTVIASLLTDDRQTGLFVTASRVFEIAYGVPMLLLTVVLPVMTLAARDDRGRLQYISQRMTEAMALAGVGVALIVAGAARPIVLVLGGTQYEDAAPVLQILSIALLSLFIGSSWSPVLIATGKQRLLAMASLVGLAVVVALGFALIPSGGAQGAATAFAIADWVLLLALLLSLRRAGHGGHLDFRFLWRLVPLAALSAAIVFFAPWGSDVARTVVGALVLAGGAFVLKVVPTELLDAIRDARGRGDGPDAPPSR